MSAAAGTFDGIAFGVSWNYRSDRKPRFAVALAGLVILLASLPGLAASMQSDARLNAFSARLSVIVRETSGSGNAAEKAIESAGGEWDAASAS